jgi:UDP-N-acetylglucosamine--N-acetylmuramyl-(pentapeptide) pyrophosphoryl-undecaprenol N-acetylglucosamine transferase
MRLVVTGGGTGGHVYPALELARHAKSRGADVEYYGSLRGQEANLCRRQDFPFRGFPSEPIYSIKHPRGWRAVARLLKASVKVYRVFGVTRPDAVFSTGGYSSAPVIRAAAMRRIPYVIHEQNAVPGRSNRIAARGASAIATTFYAAAEHFPAARVVRTGLPIRQELRQRALERRLPMDAYPLRMLVVGGSQGAAAINEAAIAVAARSIRDLRWLHLTGPKHFEMMFQTYEKLGIGSIYQVKAFLEGAEMADAYSETSIVIGRAGAGTISELAAFGLPSVLIPYPHAQANHQVHNAREIESIGGAIVMDQSRLEPATLEQALLQWIDVAAARESAREALAGWDVPDAAERIWALLEQA